MDWLDARVSESREINLFEKRITRVVQFRYVTADNDDAWHFGRYGRGDFQENYAPYKNDNTWKTAPAQRWRPLITACDCRQSVSHELPAKIAIANPNLATQICDACMSALGQHQNELLKKSPEYRRHQMVAKMLRHADEGTRRELQLKSPNLRGSMLDQLQQDGPEPSYRLACLADALGLGQDLAQ